MTNEEILKAMYERGAAGYGTAMDLARADERAKLSGLYYSQDAVDAMIQSAKAEMLKSILSQIEQPQGVDVWVSMDKVDAVISTGEPERYEQDGANFFCGYGEVIETNVYDFAKLLSIERGECAKFNIVRCV